MDSRTQRRYRRSAINEIDNLMRNPDYNMHESKFLAFTKNLICCISAKNYVFIHNPSGSEFKIEDLGRREDGDIMKTLSLVRSLILMKVKEEIEYEEYGSISVITRIK